MLDPETTAYLASDKHSELEKQFALRWVTQFPDIDLIPEVYLPAIAGTKKYRFDFGHFDAKVLIEVQGGKWQKSGHNTGAGTERDRRKLNQASSQGWVVFQLDADQIQDDGQLQQIADTIQMRVNPPTS